MTAVLVATTGGHLAQLFDLAKRMVDLDPDRLWVTFDAAQSRSLLHGSRREFIHEIKERDVVGVWRGAGFARKLFASVRVSCVISTGSGIALSFLPYAALRGIAAHYIESSARVGPPSLTGRVLQRIPGIRLYRQYPHAARGRWRYAGSVFDGFRAVPMPTRPVRRIVVTVGGVGRSFPEMVEQLAGIMPTDAEVVWQTGETPVMHLGLRARPFMPGAELTAAMREADVVIAHAGCGSALDALNAGRCPILIPRDRKRGGLVDDHQVELARWLAERGLALYREAGTVAAADLEMAAAHSIERVADPPPFKLARTA
jgi:UDP-N-acetylglucosamine--N-acetylmuramyl-(pentapeptide) pyrophosphoryl-undecaprenol N-acetylglucosamine transferase